MKKNLLSSVFVATVWQFCFVFFLILSPITANAKNLDSPHYNFSFEQEECLVDFQEIVPVIRLESSQERVINGSDVSFVARLGAANRPLGTRGSFFGYVYRGAGEGGYGKRELVDIFEILAGVTLKPQEVRDVPIEWKVPAMLESGKYVFSVVYIPQEYIDPDIYEFIDQPGPSISFEVINTETKGGIHWIPGSAKLNGELYTPGNVLQRVDADNNQSVTVSIDNTFQEEKTVQIVGRKFFGFDNVNSVDAQEEIIKVIQIASGKIVQVELPLSFPLYEIRYEDVKDVFILGIDRRVLSEGLRPYFAGLQSYPKKGEVVTIHVCLDRGISEEASSQDNLEFLEDHSESIYANIAFDGKNIIENEDVGGVFPMGKSGISISLTAEDTPKNVQVKFSTSSTSSIINTIAYSCDDSNMCSEVGGSRAEEQFTEDRIVLLVVGGVVCVLILVTMMSILIKRRGDKKRANGGTALMALGILFVGGMFTCIPLDVWGIVKSQTIYDDIPRSYWSLSSRTVHRSSEWEATGLEERILMPRKIDEEEVNSTQSVRLKNLDRSIHGAWSSPYFVLAGEVKWLGESRLYPGKVFEIQNKTLEGDFPRNSCNVRWAEDAEYSDEFVGEDRIYSLSDGEVLDWGRVECLDEAVTDYERQRCTSQSVQGSYVPIDAVTTVSCSRLVHPPTFYIVTEGPVSCEEEITEMKWRCTIDEDAQENDDVAVKLLYEDDGYGETWYTSRLQIGEETRDMEGQAYLSANNSVDDTDLPVRHYFQRAESYNGNYPDTYWGLKMVETTIGVSPNRQPSRPSLELNPNTVAPLEEATIRLSESTDPDGDAIYYEIDWDGDGIIDSVSEEGLGDGTYMYETQKSWATVGTKHIYARACDGTGLCSPFVTGEVFVEMMVSCGTNESNYDATSSSWPSTEMEDFCSLGVLSGSSPVFPNAGSSTTWECSRSDRGNIRSCTATRDDQVSFVVCPVDPTVIEGNSMQMTAWYSSSGDIISCSNAGDEADDTDVSSLASWGSNDENVVTVSDTGSLQGENAGDTSVTATYNDGVQTLSDSSSVRVVTLTFCWQCNAGNGICSSYGVPGGVCPVGEYTTESQCQASCSVPENPVGFREVAP